MECSGVRSLGALEVGCVPWVGGVHGGSIMRAEEAYAFFGDLGELEQ